MEFRLVKNQKANFQYNRIVFNSKGNNFSWVDLPKLLVEPGKKDQAEIYV